MATHFKLIYRILKLNDTVNLEYRSTKYLDMLDWENVSCLKVDDLEFTD